MLTRFLLFSMLLTSGLATAARADEPDHADHEELRGLLKAVQQSVNSTHYSDMLPYFTNDSLVTVVNQDVIKSPAELGPFFQSWIGPDKYVTTVNMTLTADDVTRLYGTGKDRWGIVRGLGEEDYHLKDGRHLDLKTRWTCTVIKENGKWKILTLHLGTNFYDNPIVTEIQHRVATYAAAAGIGGLLLGGLIGYGLRRK